MFLAVLQPLFEGVEIGVDTQGSDNYLIVKLNVLLDIDVGC